MPLTEMSDLMNFDKDVFNCFPSDFCYDEEHCGEFLFCSLFLLEFIQNDKNIFQCCYIVMT